ncbi:MAG: hypothetical protein GW778_01480 [Alphaproteobacteria bacterium]|nr:hypothetical protein [Alphaproteobacteria bacterium]
MKPFVKLLNISPLALAVIMTLSACETMEGIKQDISSIDFSNLTTASSITKDSEAQFLTDADCPTVKIVSDLSRLYEFNDNQAMLTKNLESSVQMLETNSTCTYNERSVTVDLKLEFDGELGPKGRSAANEKPFFSYPFFVAVTNANGKILAKEIFAASMTYDPGQNNQTYYETLRQIIPADTRAQGAGYKVMIGFQLAQDQLEYNRKVLAAEALAAQQVELMRLEQERLKALQEKTQAEKVAKATQTPVPPVKVTTQAIEKPTTTATGSPEPIVAPTTTRAGPFDIFKTDQ